MVTMTRQRRREGFCLFFKQVLGLQWYIEMKRRCVDKVCDFDVQTWYGLEGIIELQTVAVRALLGASHANGAMQLPRPASFDRAKFTPLESQAESGGLLAAQRQEDKKKKPSNS